MPAPLAVILLLLTLTSAVAAPAMLPREWAAPIPLRQVVVIAPQPAEAEALAAALRAVGASVDVVAPEAATSNSGLLLKPELLTKTIVALGGIHSNRAMLPLYCPYLTFGDAAYPGEDGFVIRTISAPFGAGTAAIALEASSPAGEEAAIARFAELLGGVKDGALPSIVEAHLPAATLQRISQSSYPSLRWALTADPKAARQAADLLLSTIHGEEGYAYTGDYGMERWAREWAFLQDAPGLTAEEVQRIDEALLQASLRTQTEYWRRHDGSMIGGRHQTMGTSSVAAVVQLLRRRGQPNDEARSLVEKWWSECEAYWRNAATTFHDDLEGWPSYCCPEPTLDWAMALGCDDYVMKQLPLAIARAHAVADPMDFYAGTGTYEECRPGDVYKPLWWGYLLQVCNAFHPGEGYDWLLANFPGMQPYTWAFTRNHVGAHSFATSRVPGTGAPTRFLGLTVLPLGEYRYQRVAHDRETGLAKQMRYLPAPLERTFEKLTCRESFEPSSQFLVMEGFQNALADNLPPMDANSFIRYADLGHVWLTANTERSGNLPRSAVFCTDGQNETAQPAGCDLQLSHNGAKVGLAASKLSDYIACDWTRSVIWRRGHYFVAIDLMQQNREGAFGLICTFRTPQRAWLRPDGMLAREGSAQLRVRNVDEVRLALDGGDELEGAAVPTLLRETQQLNGRVGDVRVFRNLLYAADPEHPADLQARPLGQNALLVRGTTRGHEELALIAATVPGKPLQLPDLKTDAQVLYLGADTWAQAGGKGISGKGFALTGADGDSPAAVKPLLEKLWAQAKPNQSRGVAPATGSPRPALRPVWLADPFTYLPEPVAAPVLTSDPAPEGLPNTLFDRVVTRWATVRWPAGRDVTLALDLGEPTPLGGIDFQTGIFGNYNTIPDPAKYPGPRQVQCQCSDDNFAKDLRRQELTFTSDCTFEGEHKGSVFPILRWTCRAISHRARYVRLTFSKEQWPEGLAMTELSVRWSATTSAAHVIGMLRRDVDGDGQREIVAWSDQAELAVLRQDGSKLMRKQLPGYITAVECYPELAAGSPSAPPTPRPEPRLLVTTREARLYCLTPNGDEVWKMDFLKSAEQNTDLPTGYSIGLLKKPDGSPLIVVGNYNLASFVNPDGTLAGDTRLPAAFQTMTLARGFDYDGDGVEETVSTEVWGCLSVLDANMKRKNGTYVPRGKGLLLDYYLPPTRGAADRPAYAKIVHCTEAGVGLLDLPTLKYDWRHDITPVTDCVLADANADGKPEIVLAKEDGYILVYDGAGTLLHSRLVGEPVRAVAVVQGAQGPVIAAALPGRIALYSGDLTNERELAGGEYRLLEPGDEAGMLLAAGEGAVLTAVKCGQ